MAQQTKAIAGRKNRNTKNSNELYYTDVSGISGDPIYENVGSFYELDNEKVIKGNNDSFIVLGRDRPAGPTSGYGGLGYSRASSIDIVVGRTSDYFESQNSVNLQSGIWLNPNFQYDAARIHISQKTDVDDNFNLPEGIHGKGKANSAIALKADNIRIVSRESIKLVSSVSRTDSSNLSIPGGGIELIALGPDTELESFEISQDPPIMQPIPKGNNLEKAIEEILELLDNFSGILSHYIYLQSEMNNYFACHTHLETFFGNQGIPSIDVQSPLYKNNQEVFTDVMTKIKDFKMISVPSYKKKFITNIGSNYYINSKYHFLN